MSCPQETLVRQAQAGDEEAMAALVGRYRACLLALAIDRTGRHDAAEDIVQDTLAAAVEKRASLRDARSFGPWLRQICVNACRMWHRGRTRPAPLEQIDHALAPSDATLRSVCRREDRREIRRALEALPENNRLALLLHAVEGLPYQQIAEFLGVPKSTIHGRLVRARRELRRRLRGRLFGALGVAVENE